jgi:hypothetical protein
MKTDLHSGFSLATVLAVLFVLAFLLVTIYARAEVTPANTSITFLRGDTSVEVSGGPFYKGVTLLLTNCVLYAGATTNLGVQDLTSCSITCKVGSVTTAYVTSAGTVQSAAAGTFWVSFTVPTNLDNAAILQVTVYDNAGNSYTYPWKNISIRSAL